MHIAPNIISFGYRNIVAVLNPGLSGYLRKLFPKIMRSLPGCEVIEYNIQIDHIHMVMIIPPKYKVSEVISRIKAQTASRLRKKFSWLSKVYWKENIVWSPGYFVSTIGLDEKSILKYVRWQKTQDLGCKYQMKSTPYFSRKVHHFI